MLRPLNQRAPSVEALARVEAWCRERFSLAAADTVMVSEIACAVPGCPPLETVVAFWTAQTARPEPHHFKVFKPLAQVESSDLPFYWQKAGLRSDSIDGCDCC